LDIYLTFYLFKVLQLLHRKSYFRNNDDADCTKLGMRLLRLEFNYYNDMKHTTMHGRIRLGKTLKMLVLKCRKTKHV